jgi:hypothetical protein
VTVIAFRGAVNIETARRSFSRYNSTEASMVDRPDFPTMDQVEKASREQLAKWYRFLPSGQTKEQQQIMDRIAERFKQLGGTTPELSKKIGFLAGFCKLLLLPFATTSAE